MKQYDSTSACDAFNVGLLAAIRAKNLNSVKPPEFLKTESELQAWHDGLDEGEVIREKFVA